MASVLASRGSGLAVVATAGCSAAPAIRSRGASASDAALTGGAAAIGLRWTSSSRSAASYSRLADAGLRANSSPAWGRVRVWPTRRRWMSPLAKAS